MNARGVAFSTGAACHGMEEKETENHVLQAIGLERRAAREVTRFSFCKHTTAEEVDRAADIFAECTAELQRRAPKKKSKKKSAKTKANTETKAEKP